MNIHTKIQNFNELRYSRPLQLTQLTRSRITRMIELAGSNNRILDIGCYDGTIAKELISRGNRVVGIDISQGAIKLAKKNGIEAYVCNIEEDPLPKSLGKFDVAIAGEIIEHIFDPDSFLNKIKTVLKPNGHIILSTPNLAGLGSRLALLLGQLPWMVENDILPGKSGHIRYFTIAELQKILNRNGFRVQNFTTDSVGINTTTIPLIEKIAPSLGRILIIKARKV